MFRLARAPLTARVECQHVLIANAMELVAVMVVMAVILATRQAANRDGKRAVADLGSVSNSWITEHRTERQACRPSRFQPRPDVAVGVILPAKRHALAVKRKQPIIADHHAMRIAAGTSSPRTLRRRPA